MEKNKKIWPMLILSGITAAALLVQPTAAEASGGYHRYHKKQRHHGYHGHYGHYRRQHYRQHHPHYPLYSFGELIINFPDYIRIRVGGKKFYYYEGVYYRRRHGDYIAVPAPIGACIKELPYGIQKIYVDGYPYYKYNGVYYEHTPEGYVVIEAPGSGRAKKSGTVNVITEEYTEESVTLNIPNSNGDYTSVTITRKGDGYVGPQGEYYEKFPKIEQLKVIYGT